MLAEKFFLVLETLRSHASDDDRPEIVTSPVVTSRVVTSLDATGVAVPEAESASRRKKPLADERA